MPLPRPLGAKLYRGTVTRVAAGRAWVELSSAPGYEVGGEAGLQTLGFAPAPAAGDRVMVAEMTSPSGEMVIVGSVGTTVPTIPTIPTIPPDLSPSTGINPLTGKFHVDGYGALGDDSHDDGPALQACFDDADNYIAATQSYVVGQRGGAVHFPILSRGGSTFAKYRTKQSLYIEARVMYESVNGGASAGGRVVTIKADPAGTFTNGQYGEKFLIKMGRQPASATPLGIGGTTAIGYWGHGCRMLRFNLECNHVTGLAGIHWWGAGETMYLDDIEINNTGVTSRTVSDATFNGTTTVVSASGFADDDLRATVSSTDWPTYTDLALTDVQTTNGSTTVTSSAGLFVDANHRGAEFKSGTAAFTNMAYIVSVTDSTHAVLSEPATADGTGKSMTFGAPRTNRISQIVNSTTALLDRPVTISGSAKNLTINRPRPGMQAHGFGATGRIGTLQGGGISGYLLEIVDGSGVVSIDSLSTDGAGGGLMRLRQCARSADQFTVLIKTLKTESNGTGLDDYSSMDPLIMIDYCGMVNVAVLNGTSSAGARYGRNLVRIQNNLSPGATVGFPSLSLQNWEAANPYNVQYLNILEDLNTGTIIPAGSLYAGGGDRFYPDITYSKDKYHKNGTFYGDTISVAVKLAIAGALTVSGTSVPDFAAVGGTSAAAVQTFGDKLAFAGGTGAHAGLGMQSGRVVCYAPGGSNGFAVRSASASGQKSSSTDVFAFLTNGHMTAQGGTSPSAAAGANAGTLPPSAAMNANSKDTRGSVTFGTGSGPTAGPVLVVNYGSSYSGTTVPPFVTISTLNDATAALRPSVTAMAVGSFTVSFGVAPAAGQANTVYGISWTAIG